jgi:hypothetical protein
MAKNLGNLVAGLSRADQRLVGRLFDLMAAELNRDLDPAYQARIKAEAEARAAAEQAAAQREFEAAKADASYFLSAEFRQDVIDELLGTGATLEQATGRTRDQARLFNEARQLGMM